jgi:solute carrier family 25 thiamine pyrophosphate transporter 19
MVGYNENSDHQLSEFWQGVAGISSGIITRVLCQPLDVLKIRFQVQNPTCKTFDEIITVYTDFDF